METPPEQQPAEPPPPTIGLGGCLTGLALGGMVLGGGIWIVGALGLAGRWVTLAEILVMGLALGATFFIWKVAATADQIQRERESRDE